MGDLQIAAGGASGTPEGAGCPMERCMPTIHASSGNGSLDVLNSSLIPRRRLLRGRPSLFPNDHLFTWSYRYVLGSKSKARVRQTGRGRIGTNLQRFYTIGLDCEGTPQILLGPRAQGCPEGGQEGHRNLELMLRWALRVVLAPPHPTGGGQGRRSPHSAVKAWLVLRAVRTGQLELRERPSSG